MRYKIVEGSVPGHDCCYTHTIVDTERKDWNEKSDYVLCETKNEMDAKLLCDALNEKEEKNDRKTDT